MDSLTVDIITAERSLVVGAQANSLIAPGIKGEFEVLPGHTTFLTTLEPGRVVLSGTKGEQRFVVNGGFAEVMQGHIRILADRVAVIDELDRAIIDKCLADLEARAAELDPCSDEAEALATQRRFLEIQKDLIS